jgi:hypothetical protein
MTRTADVDLRKGQYVLSSLSQTSDGFSIANGAYEVLDESVTDGELGAAVARMLDASRTGVPTPDLRSGPSAFAPVLAHLGVRSYGAFMKGTRHVGLEQTDAGTVVTPYRNGGAREGFVGIAEAAVQLTRPAMDELGRAVRAALDRAS